MLGSEDFRHEQRRVATGMAMAAVVTVVALGLAAIFGPTETRLAPIGERLGAALRADVFVVGWLAAAIGNVARLRFFSRDDIAGSGAGPGSHPVRDAVAILQNTTEQVVLAVPTHLAFAVIVAPRPAVPMTLAGLFCAGRLLFWLGYRRGAAGRALGFALTFYPTVATLGLSAAVLLFGNAA